MTVKKQWMLALILSAVLSVVINSLVLGSLINRYFIDSSQANYDRHYQQIVEFTKKALLEGYTGQQLEVQLETHLIDPITGIRLYDANGNLLAAVDGKQGRMYGMMRGGMMQRMMGSFEQEIDSSDITDGSTRLGMLQIVKYSSVGSSMQTRLFTFALIRNSLFSFGIVMLLMLLIGSFLSRRMSRDLRNTAEMATDIDLGNETAIEKSRVREIRIIQQSLETLQNRLKLKQVSRKRLLDELVHQTRTPLTILKTHLEGFEDGMLTMTPEEIKTCEAQIETISSIITNMSSMIDAEKDLDTIKPEDVEIGQLMKQILGALKMQFEKKQIELTLNGPKRACARTDQYKVSQCIYNILTNAYKFTNPGGKVTVTYDQTPDGIRIVIEDTGSGIDPEDMDRLFDAYYRGTNTDRTTGEGIGLYVVKENLGRIGGSIDVESEYGKWSRFTITVPDMK